MNPGDWILYDFVTRAPEWLEVDAVLKDVVFAIDQDGDTISCNPKNIMILEACDESV